MANNTNEIDVSKEDIYDEFIHQKVIMEQKQFEQKVIMEQKQFEQKVEEQLQRYGEKIKTYFQKIVEGLNSQLIEMRKECEEAKKECEEAKKECEETKRQCIENSTQQLMLSNNMIEMMKQTKLDDFPPPPPELNYGSGRQGTHKSYQRYEDRSLETQPKRTISSKELKELKLTETQLKEQQEALKIFREKTKKTNFPNLFQTSKLAIQEQQEQQEREIERKRQERVQRQRDTENFQKQFCTNGGARLRTAFGPLAQFDS